MAFRWNNRTNLPSRAKIGGTIIAWSVRCSGQGGDYGKKKSGVKLVESNKTTTSRKLNYEELLCDAIRMRVQVRCSYGHELDEHILEPDVVYLSPDHKICVSGLEPCRGDEALTFEISKIRQLRLTDQRFVAHHHIEWWHRKFREGIVCSL